MSYNIFLKLLMIFLLAILQVTLMPKIGILGVYPNLILLTSIILILMREDSLAYLTAGFGGLILDLFSPWRFGFYTLIFIILIFLFSFLTEKIFDQINRVLLILSIIGIVAIFDTISFYISEHSLSLFIFIDSIYSLIFALIIYLILKTIIKMPEDNLI